MRIVYFSESFWPTIGGIQVSLTEVAPAMRARGHEVAVVTDRRGPQLPAHDSFAGVPVHRLPLVDSILTRDPKTIGRARRDLRALLRDLRPDLIHIRYTFGASGFFIPLLSPCARVATVLTLAGFLRKTAISRATMLRNAVAASTWVTTPSQAVLDHLMPVVPELAGRASVVTNSVVPPAQPPVAIPSGPATVLCLGRMTREKGFDVAVEAMRLVREQFPDARLVLGGAGHEEPSLRAQAHALGMGDSVDFPGWVSPWRRWELLDRATVLAVPSLDVEGFGRVAAEAAFRLRPVVASRTGGLVEVVEDGKTGMLVEPGRADRLAAELIGLLEDRELARRLGEQAGARARRLFTLPRQIRALEDLYSQLAERQLSRDGSLRAAPATARAEPPAG